MTEPLSRGRTFIKIRRMTMAFLDLSDQIYQKICTQVNAARPMIPADVLQKLCKNVNDVHIKYITNSKGVMLRLRTQQLIVKFYILVLQTNDIFTPCTQLSLEI